MKDHWSFPEKKYLVCLVESTVIEYGVFNNDVSRTIIRSISEKILVLCKRLKTIQEWIWVSFLSRLKLKKLNLNKQNIIHNKKHEWNFRKIY